MDFITTVVVYFSASVVFAIAVVIFLWRIRVNHRVNYPSQWEAFKKALDLNDLNNIAKNGRAVLWNDNLEEEHKRIIFTEIEKRRTNPELKKLWNDVHYKTKGVEPVEGEYL